MPQNAYFLRTRDLLVSQKTTQTLFFSTLHPLSTVIFATATLLAFVLLRNSRFNFHCYTQRETTLTQKLTRKWRCDLSWLFARKITKSIHSCKPASLNRPIKQTPYGPPGNTSRKITHGNGFARPQHAPTLRGSRVTCKVTFTRPQVWQCPDRITDYRN